MSDTTDDTAAGVHGEPTPDMCCLVTMEDITKQDGNYGTLRYVTLLLASIRSFPTLVFFFLLTSNRTSNHTSSHHHHIIHTSQSSSRDTPVGNGDQRYLNSKSSSSCSTANLLILWSASRRPTAKQNCDDCSPRDLPYFWRTPTAFPFYQGIPTWTNCGTRPTAANERPNWWAPSRGTNEISCGTSCANFSLKRTRNKVTSKRTVENKNISWLDSIVNIRV